MSAENVEEKCSYQVTPNRYSRSLAIAFILVVIVSSVYAVTILKVARNMDFTASWGESDGRDRGSQAQ